MESLELAVLGAAEDQDGGRRADPPLREGPDRLSLARPWRTTSSPRSGCCRTPAAPGRGSSSTCTARASPASPLDQHARYWRRADARRRSSATTRPASTCLRDHDLAGTNWRGNHYSGNFWWARSEHIRRLPDIRGSAPPPAADHARPCLEPPPAVRVLDRHGARPLREPRRRGTSTSTRPSGGARTSPTSSTSCSRRWGATATPRS